MWTRRITTVFLALFAGYWDATISPWVPGSLGAVQISLPLVLVFSAYSSEERAITAALASGVVLDVFLPSNAGLVSIRYVAIALLIRLLAQNVLTNRSLVSAYAMGAASVLLNRLLLALLEGGSALVGRATIPEPHAGILAELVWMLLCMTGVFLVFAAFTKRFLPPISRTDQYRIPLWRT